VPGGATFREAHLVMEMLHDSGLVGSLDLVELNPRLTCSRPPAAATRPRKARSGPTMPSSSIERMS
jgi:arginase family enzyme